NDDAEAASKEVDTSPAGFNLVLADGSENVVNGSHVAKIYKEGTTKEDIEAGEAKKQWKFDAAIDSLVSFNISGEEKADGKLEVNGDNEGISSALHMTIEGGEITISSADDAINASEDGVSVLTINGGTITCDAGAGKEGDGIDSNGWIIQNGGCVTAYANPDSQDSGIDSDLGIYMNGGVLFASGNMYDEVSADSEQAFMVRSFSEQVEGGQFLMLKDSSNESVAAFCAPNDFTTMVYSSDLLSDGDYTLYKAASVTGEQNGGIYTNITDYEEGVQLQYSSAGMMGPNGGSRGFGGQMREKREGMELPPEGEAGDRFKDREKIEKPEGAEEGQMPELPEGSEEGQAPEEFGKMGGEQGLEAGSEPSTIFTISGKQNIFSQITEIQQEKA
ncbi:MAG: carbohydrate-binding domain-containing protein, partial [Fusicatenibacter sp.]